jgi:sterol desaturase/sphingolipid hydroxylase (fatty acid hydroxylase superfamily)
VAYYAATRSLALGLSLLLGNAIAMLYYEWVHYVAHIPYVPATAVGRWMKKYHLLHHYLNERLWYGVTNPSIDLLARTYMPAAEAERSTRTRVLYP